MSVLHLLPDSLERSARARRAGLSLLHAPRFREHLASQFAQRRQVQRESAMLPRFERGHIDFLVLMQFAGRFLESPPQLLKRLPDFAAKGAIINQQQCCRRRRDFTGLGSTPARFGIGLGTGHRETKLRLSTKTGSDAKSETPRDDSRHL